MQQEKVAERDDNHTSDYEEPSSGSNQAEVCTNRDFGLDNIVTYIESLNGHGVTCGGMTGKKIKTVLGLKTTPQLRNSGHKQYFYSIKSDKMKEISQLYKEENNASETNDSGLVFTSVD